MGSSLVRVDRPAVAVSGTDATMRFLNFIATQIENDNTRAAYLRAAREFLAWCDGQKLGLLADIHPIHGRGMDQAIEDHAFGADSQTSPCRYSLPVRLAGDGPRSCKPIRLCRCVGRAMLCARAKRRCWMRLKCACCSTASAARRRLICATRR